MLHTQNGFCVQCIFISLQLLKTSFPILNTGSVNLLSSYRSQWGLKTDWCHSACDLFLVNILLAVREQEKHSSLLLTTDSIQSFHDILCDVVGGHAENQCHHVMVPARTPLLQDEVDALCSHVRLESFL